MYAHTLVYGLLLVDRETDGNFENYKKIFERAPKKERLTEILFFQRPIVIKYSRILRVYVVYAVLMLWFCFYIKV